MNILKLVLVSVSAIIVSETVKQIFVFELMVICDYNISNISDNLILSNL